MKGTEASAAILPLARRRIRISAVPDKAILIVQSWDRLKKQLCSSSAIPREKARPRRTQPATPIHAASTDAHGR